jgi:RNA polymerase sigma-70 factor (ECF subfamily)
VSIRPDSGQETGPDSGTGTGATVTAAVTEAVTAAFREEWGREVATMIRVTGDWDLAEECAQEAFAVALKQWQSDGIPVRPGAWLTTVARRTALNRLRRSSTEEVKLQEVAMTPAPPGWPELPGSCRW